MNNEAKMVGNRTALVGKDTATDIALAYREIEVAEKLLAEIEETMAQHETPEIRDAFGRLQGGLQLGIPSGASSHRLFNVPWPLARPIIQAHIAACQAKLLALSEKAKIEIGNGDVR